MLCRAYYLVGLEPDPSDRLAAQGGCGSDAAPTHPDDLALAQLRARFPVPFDRPELHYMVFRGSVEDVRRRAAELMEWLNREVGGEKRKLVTVLGILNGQR